MSSATSPFPDLHIGVGSYDATVIGLHLSTDADALLALEARFAYAAHAGSVRALAQLGGTLASASSDETVRVYDVARRAEVAALVHHAGTVNALALARDPLSGAPLLFSAADDAALCITRAADWRLLKRLPGHLAPVTALAVHPSVKVALTLSSDRSLFMWNLERGRVAFSAKTKPIAASAVHWSPDGERYMLVCETRAALYTAEGVLEGTFEHGGTVRTAAFLDDRRVVTGGEDRVVRVWDARQPEKPVATPATHSIRVRAVGAVRTAIVSADSGGGIKVWDERRGGPPRLETEVGGGGMRLTCLSVAVASDNDFDTETAGRNFSLSKRSHAELRQNATGAETKLDSSGDAVRSTEKHVGNPRTTKRDNLVALKKPAVRGTRGAKSKHDSTARAPSKAGTASSRKRLKRKDGKPK